MSMKIIRTPETWEKFKKEFCQNHDVPPSATWGNGPQVFPCVANAIYFPLGSRVLCCYFYPDAARELLNADLHNEAAKKDIVEDAGLREQVEALRKAHGELAKMFREYATVANAHLRVFLERALGTFYKDKAWYESRLAQELAWIDRQNEEKRRSLAVDDLTAKEPPPGE